MKKTILAILVIALLALYTSCQKGDTGTTGSTGPTGAGSYSVMEFQEGVFPSSAYTGFAQDCRIVNTSAFENLNYGSAATAILGYGGPHVKFGLFSFDISQIPVNATVNKAYLTLYCTGSIDGVPVYYLQKLTTNWNETTVTWISNTTATAWAVPGGDIADGIVSDQITVDTIGRYYTFTITPSVVQEWVSTPSSNRGLILKSAVISGASSIEAAFAMRENTAATYRPKLTVYYTPN